VGWDVLRGFWRREGIQGLSFEEEECVSETVAAIISAHCFSLSLSAPERRNGISWARCEAGLGMCERGLRARASGGWACLLSCCCLQGWCNNMMGRAVPSVAVVLFQIHFQAVTHEA